MRSPVFLCIRPLLLSFAISVRSASSLLFRQISLQQLSNVTEHQAWMTITTTSSSWAYFTILCSLRSSSWVQSFLFSKNTTTQTVRPCYHLRRHDSIHYVRHYITKTKTLSKSPYWVPAWLFSNWFCCDYDDLKPYMKRLSVNFCFKCFSWCELIVSKLSWHSGCNATK